MQPWRLQPQSTRFTSGDQATCAPMSLMAVTGPRTLCVHSREGAIDVKALIGKLQEIALIPQQIGRLANGDLEITFDSQRDKERFLGLCFVHVPRRQWAPGLADPPAIWVRAFGKPKELSLEVIRHNKMNSSTRLASKATGVEPKMQSQFLTPHYKTTLAFDLLDNESERTTTDVGATPALSKHVTMTPA
eukprot:gene15880-7212_t